MRMPRNGGRISPEWTAPEFEKIAAVLVGPEGALEALRKVTSAADAPSSLANGPSRFLVGTRVAGLG